MFYILLQWIWAFWKIRNSLTESVLIFSPLKKPLDHFFHHNYSIYNWITIYVQWIEILGFFHYWGYITKFVKVHKNITWLPFCFETLIILLMRSSAFKSSKKNVFLIFISSQVKIDRSKPKIKLLFRKNLNGSMRDK